MLCSTRIGVYKGQDHRSTQIFGLNILANQTLERTCTIRLHSRAVLRLGAMPGWQGHFMGCFSQAVAEVVIAPRIFKIYLDLSRGLMPLYSRMTPR